MITEVFKLFETESAPTTNIYFTGQKKYLKQLRRLWKTLLKVENYKKILLTREGIYKQLCVPKTMLKEVMYRIHNAPSGRHLEITRTLKEFRKRFFSPNFVDLV